MDEPRLRRAFVAGYGSERGREATAEALAYAWERWAQIEPMPNAVEICSRNFVCSRVSESIDTSR